MPTDRYDIICPECGEIAIMTDTHWVCPNDGLVIQPKFEQGSVLLEETAQSYGKRFAAVSNDPQRTVRMGSTVGWQSGESLVDGQRSWLDISTRNHYRNLQWRNDRVARMFSDERLSRWLQVYNRACNVLNLPLSLQKDGAILLRKVYHNSEKYQRINSLVAATIYLVCRYRRYIIPLATIEESFCQMGYPTSGKDIIKSAMIIRKLTQIRVRPFGPQQYLSSLIEQLRASHEFDELIRKRIRPRKQHKYWFILQKITSHVITRLPERELTSRNPRILAAASIVGGDTFLARTSVEGMGGVYVDSRRRGLLTQTAVAKILQMREHTLREHYLIAVKPALIAMIDSPNLILNVENVGQQG